MLLYSVSLFLLAVLTMVNCPNCDVEVRDRGLSMHLSRYCRMRDAATTSALTERLEHRQAIAQAARVEEERRRQEEHEVQHRQQQQRQPRVEEVSIIF